MKLVLKVLLLLIMGQIHQDTIAQDIEVFTKENESITKIVAKNSSDKYTYSVSLSLKCSGYKVTAPPPYEVALRPGEEVDVVTLIEKPNERLDLSYGVNYKKVMTEQQKHDQIISEKLVILNKDTVFVFSGLGCDKSKLCLSKLSKSKRKYVDVPLSEPQNNELLSRVLVAKMKPGELFHFKTPIIVVNSVPLIEPKDVDEFILSLSY
jgi:hypothetical protein